MFQDDGNYSLNNVLTDSCPIKSVKSNKCAKLAEQLKKEDTELQNKHEIVNHKNEQHINSEDILFDSTNQKIDIVAR